MTREEEIYAATQQFVGEYLDGLYDAETFAKKCAQWADEHPKNPWRDASKEPPKSEDEVFIYAGGVTMIGRYIQDENIWRVPVFGVIDDADYWMPKPELPKA